LEAVADSALELLLESPDILGAQRLRAARKKIQKFKFRCTSFPLHSFPDDRSSVEKEM
jgi:hypothetical protein